MPAPGPHGGDGARVAAAVGLDPEDVLDLSQSLNPLAPDPVAVVASRLGELRRYPDPEAATSALSEAMEVDSSRILLTNGGSEAISLVASETGGRVEEPEFSLLPRGRGRGPLWRSNPNNPSGLLASESDRADVWDEAFFPLSTGLWTRGDKGSVVVGSLTKLLACPGLRLGYVLGEPELVERLKRRQPLWSVNGLAASSLPELLEHVDLPKWAAEIAELRSELVRMLRERGFDPRPSDAPWVLVEAPGLRERLARQGVVVRDCASFGMTGVVRVAVPDPEGIERLHEALRAEVREEPAREAGGKR